MGALYSYNLLQILKKPYLVLTYFTKSVRSYFYSKTVFSLLMIRMVKENPKNILVCSLGAITYNILAKNYFYKIGFFSGAIKREVDNYRCINKQYPALTHLLPKISYNRYGVLEYIKVEKYFPLDEKEGINYAIRILAQLRAYGQKTNCASSQFKYIAQGLKLVGVLYGLPLKNKLERELNKTLAQPWTIGPIHGDFYLANILKDAENNPKMIDLDEFSAKGLQSLDAFNFMLDFYARENKTTWTQVLVKLLQSSDAGVVHGLEDYLDYSLQEVALLYTLNRLGYENYHYHFLSNSVREEYMFVKNF